METGALLEKMAEKALAEEKAATLRAGLIAAAVYNVNRKKGSRPIKPQDFLARSANPVVEVEPEEMERLLDAWAGTVNKRFDA